MNKPSTPSAKPSDKKATRQEKLAAALRANLKRRKAGRRDTKEASAKGDGEHG